MAIVIAAFSHQEVPINTEFMLNVSITGTGSNTEIRVKGELHNFYHRWNATDEQIEIRGSSDRIVYEAEFTITAGNKSRTGTFSVVPIAPVIVDPGDQIFVKGFPTKLDVTINNQVNAVKVSSDWIGLKASQGGVGVVIEGDIANEEVRFDSGDINIIAESPAGNDELNFNFEFGGIPVYVVDDGTNKVYLIGVDIFNLVITEIRNHNLPSGNSNPFAIARGNNKLYVADVSDDRIYHFPDNIQSGTPVASSFLLPTGNNTPQSLGYDPATDDLYCGDSADEQIYVFPAGTTESRATASRVFIIPQGVGSGGLAIDGDVIWTSLVNNLYSYSKNTANGATAVQIHTITNVYSENGNIDGLAVFGDYILCVNFNADRMYIVEKTAVNGDDTISIDLPSVITTPKGLTV